MKAAAAIFAVLLTAMPMHAQESDADLSLDEQIATPALGSRRHADATSQASRLAATLAREGFSTSTLRDGEVVLATVPCDMLFAANSTTPKREAAYRLRALRDIVSRPERYKIVVAVHADDTGDEAYSDSLTEARANAVDDLLWQVAGHNDDTNVVIYGLGRDEPLVENATRRDRRKNRRVEFYIVPL